MNRCDKFLFIFLNRFWCVQVKIVAQPPQMVGSFPSPNKEAKARAANSVSMLYEKPCAKRGSGSGVVCDFLAGLQIFDPSPGAMLTRNCESHFCQLVFTPDHSVKWQYAKQHLQKNRSTFLQLHYEQASNQLEKAKCGPYLAVFFLTKEKVKITKVTNINKSIINEYI